MVCWLPGAPEIATGSLSFLLFTYFLSLGFHFSCHFIQLFLTPLDNRSLTHENTYPFKYLFLGVSVSSMHNVNEDENDFETLYGSGQSIKLFTGIGSC